MTSLLLHYSRLAWPTDWASLFGREAPLLLELGFGSGDYLVELARANPSSNVLGIEISLPSLRRGARKIAKAKLENARVLQADSRAALWLLFPPQSISGVTINFPDPWPKASHHRRRLVSKRFLDLLATRMLPCAPLDIATDHDDYAPVIERLLLQSPYFESRLSQPVVTDPEYRRGTKYEQVALAEGRIPRYFPWKRNSAAALDEFKILEVTAVPHVVLLSTLNLDEIGERFEPFYAEEGDVHVKYSDMYRSLGGDLLMTDVYVSEEPYHQRVGLSIRLRQGGDMVVSLQEIGFPRPTRGIHLAIQHLVAWLHAHDPAMIIVNSTLIESEEGPAIDDPLAGSA